MYSIELVYYPLQKTSVRTPKIFTSVFLLLCILPSSSIFVPNRTDYDAYGTKIAVNEVLLVKANNAGDPPNFFIQLTPFNDTRHSSQCSINYSNILQDFIYSVAVGKKPKSNKIQFVFAGESVGNIGRTFIGTATYNSTATYSNWSSSCATNFVYSTYYLDTYSHQENYVIGVEPNGLIAYGFSNDFTFAFDVQSNSMIGVWPMNLTWTNISFLPRAIDISTDFGIIAGFIQNDPQARVKYGPAIYLLNFNSTDRRPIVVDQFIPIATPGTWQDLLTNDDANSYSAKYDMSISINGRGDTLVGMQFINRVFLLSVNVSNPKRLIYVSRNTNGRSLGNGKSVAWLNDGNIAAVLVNTYTLSYQWVSSQVFMYDMASNTYSSNSSPVSVFPNYHQLLPTVFNAALLNIVSSPRSLTVMDIEGHLLVFNPASPGFYPSIPLFGSSPLMTSETQCLSGMYKDLLSISDCILCPPGTRSTLNTTIKCVTCSSDSFCPLGSVHDVSQSALKNVVQVIAYPKSPESTIFDEILIQNMFHIGSGHCLLVSPLFWSLSVAVTAALVVITIEIVHSCFDHPTSTRIRKQIQVIFKKVDVIREGELWMGGLASFSLLIMVCFAYSFSVLYFKQYPIEETSDSSFACDPSIRNAKFETSLQSLGIPRTESESHMFDLLNQQNLTLNIDFINTPITCDIISLQALFGTTWSTIRWSTCQNVKSILSLTVLLPFQQISLQVTLAAVQTIGALRIGLTGPEHEEDLYHLKELSVFNSFSKNGFVLAQTLQVPISITKVINETSFMEKEGFTFAGIYILTHGFDVNSLFLSQDQYVRSTATQIILTVVLSETPYYVKNSQLPIARLAEIIFRNLLFTIVCLEIFGLVFIVCRLAAQPIYQLIRFIRRSRRKRNQEKHQPMNTDERRPDRRSTSDITIEQMSVFTF